MIELSAKAQFLKAHTENEIVTLREVMARPDVKRLMIYSLALLAEQGLTLEQLSGARAYQMAMLNLPEPLEIPKTEPQKTFKKVPTPDGR